MTLEACWYGIHYSLGHISCSFIWKLPTLYSSDRGFGDYLTVSLVDVWGNWRGTQEIEPSRIRWQLEGRDSESEAVTSSYKTTDPKKKKPLSLGWNTRHTDFQDVQELTETVDYFMLLISFNDTQWSSRMESGVGREVVRIGTNAQVQSTVIVVLIAFSFVI